MLAVKGLKANVGGKEILRGLDFAVSPGEVHAIMGPNGSGKSTFAHVLSGREGYEVTAGSATFEGQDLLALEPEERARLGLFLAFQYPVELPGVNNTYFLKAALNSILKSRGEPELDAVSFLRLIKKKLKILHLDDSLLKRAVNAGFSGGEKKRNEIFQMALLEPKLAILDETDSGLDIDALRVVADGVNALRSPERSMIVVTHYQRLLDYIQPDHVHVLSNRRTPPRRAVDARRRRHLGEGAVAVVAVERVRPVIGDVDVGIAVAVHVPHRHPHPIAGVAEARGGGDVVVAPVGGSRSYQLATCSVTELSPLFAARYRAEKALVYFILTSLVWKRSRRRSTKRLRWKSILQSGLFDKAPRLGKFFCYICERYFAGHADQIKEYSIATEALGRSADFDSKRDSIVRVEAHRLRKRLDDYYNGLGSTRPVQIVIPNGQYRPHFLIRDLDSPPLAIPPSLPPEPEFTTVKVVEPAPGKNGRGELRWALTISVMLLLVVGGMIVGRARKRGLSPIPPKQSEEIWTGSSAEPVPAEFRMLAGYRGAPFLDRQNHMWAADAYYKGGTSLPIAPDHFIEGLPDPHLLKSQRSGSFRYDIPLAQGSHELRLYFAETEFGRGNPQGGGEGSRTFRVSLNGRTLDRCWIPWRGRVRPTVCMNAY